MSLLDKRKKEREGIKHKNPMANHDIKVKALKKMNINLAGETHSKLTVLANMYDMNKAEFVLHALNQFIDKQVEGKDKEIFNRQYQREIENRLEIIRRKEHLEKENNQSLFDGDLDD